MKIFNKPLAIRDDAFRAQDGPWVLSIGSHGHQVQVVVRNIHTGQEIEEYMKLPKLAGILAKGLTKGEG